MDLVGISRANARQHESPAAFDASSALNPIYTDRASGLLDRCGAPVVAKLALVSDLAVEIYFHRTTIRCTSSARSTYFMGRCLVLTTRAS